MMHHKLNSILALATLLFVALACNFSFTTANISSLKVSKEKSAATETSSFEPSATIYVVAQISNTSDKHQVTSRILYDDVAGQSSGQLVPGAETTLEVPGAAAATFTLTPPGVGWAPGKYKVEVTMKSEDGKQVDQETGSFTVTGSSAPEESGSRRNNPANDGTAADSVRLTDVKLTADDSSEPERSADTFAPSDFIYVMYTVENVPRGAAIYCNMYADGESKTLLRSLSFLNPPESRFVERFDLDPKGGWDTGPHLIELSYRANQDAEMRVLKNLRINIG